MNPVVHLVTNRLRLRQDTPAGRVYLEAFEAGRWAVKDEIDALAAESWQQLFKIQAGGGGGAATMVVAAADSRDPARADFKVPEGSTEAQTVINQAIAALPSVGGKVVLMEGTYLVSGGIVVPSNVHLELLAGATIKIADGVSTDFDVISNSDPTNGNVNVVVSGPGVIDGNRANVTGTHRGVYFRKVTGGVVLNLRVRSMTGSGVYLDQCYRCNVSGCLCEDNGGSGIYQYYSDRNVLRGNVCRSNVGNGIYSRYSSNCAFVGNVCVDNGGNGLEVRNGSGIEITGNVLNYNTGSGGYFDTLGSSVIGGNVAYSNQFHGLYAYLIESGLTDNVCTSNSQSGTGNADNINVSGTRNNVQGNLCRRGPIGIYAAYGIRVASGTDNLVCNNDCYQGGNTGGIFDAGTGTNFGAGNRNGDGTWSTTPN